MSNGTDKTARQRVDSYTQKISSHCKPKRVRENHPVVADG
jgi:hypothetical protein